MNAKTLNRIFAGFVFLFSFVVYFMTMAPTVSFWDCGEFIACSYKMAVPHPPGAPLYLMVGRIFTLIPIFADIAKRINLISVLSSAFTITFLYLIIVSMVRQYLKDTKEGFMMVVPFLGGAIGALTFAFTTSFWFNAVEAEVYAPSMLFTSLVVWMAVKWSENSDKAGNERYLLGIMYVVGLALGVHLLNVLALPMVFMLVYYKKYEINLQSFVILVIAGGALTGFVYPGLVQGIPIIAEHGGFFGLLVVLIALVITLYWAAKNNKHFSALFLASVLLIVLGYSTYLMIYVRSGLDPNIDENNPETIEKFISYMQREQYGEHSFDRAQAMAESPNGKKYSSTMDFFWNYQIQKMYVRYFNWNFLGIDDDGVGFSVTKFLMIPLLLGLWGAYYHFKRDWKYALAVFALFFMTGLAIIIYLNQPDPQPRERDYSYVGSFFAFAIWIGIGVASILEFLTNQTKNSATKGIVPASVALLLFVLSPIQLLTKNYDEHDRSGNYVAWDYSYNMLMSCDDNAVLYTNGDNDTFPLWYLQEVENVRTDVRVANLSLLNTSWYISQLKHKDPKVPISLSDAEIDKIMPRPWQEKTFKVPIPEDKLNRDKEDYQRFFKFENSAAAKTMSFKLGPKFYGRYLRVQDLMILNTLVANQFRQPLYFAVTCSQDNMLDGLYNYLRMDGLTFNITTLPRYNINPDVLYDNLMNKYQYRNLNNKDVYFNPSIISLLQNYRSAFIQLANYYAGEQDSVKIREIMAKAEEVMPPDVIPHTNSTIRRYMTAYGIYSNLEDTTEMTPEKYSVADMETVGMILSQLGAYPKAISVFKTLLDTDPNSSRALGALVDMYGRTEQYQDGVELLERWVAQNPNDRGAKARLQDYKNRLAEQN